MSNQIQSPNDKKPFNLEERTALFGEVIIKFAKTIRENTINRSLINQLIRSSTSIGANYMEADGADSKKEAKETLHWLRMIAVANPDQKEECRKLWKETHELTLIFSSILLK